MKRIILITILLCNLSSFCQETNGNNYYFDENNEQIEILDYLAKCSSFLYRCNKYEKENSIFNVMLEIYKFGNLSEIETSQIQKLLSRDTGKDLNNKTLIISFRDFLYGPNGSNLEDNLSFDKHYTLPMKESKYKSIRKKNDSKQKKCIQKLNKNDASVLYLYDENIDYSYQSKHFTWHKISPSIKSTFFNEKSPNILILKPDGNFFRYTSNHSEDLLKNLITKDWAPYLKDYRIAKNNLPKNPNGFFKQMKNHHFNDEEVFIKFSQNITREQKRRVIQSQSKKVVVIKNDSEISQYLSNKQPCFSYPSF